MDVDDNMKIEIEIDEADYRLMQKNKYAHDSVLTKDYMLDILHDIVDQIV
jgi:hypothetical protein|tara:strand:+ start:552 stop:701 length:150 start_codon:yes stop_codon:yes gene_type:complete